MKLSMWLVLPSFLVKLKLALKNTYLVLCFILDLILLPISDLVLNTEDFIRT